MKEEIQQKNSEAHLEEINQRLQTILQAIPDNVYIIDSEGCVVDLNEKESVYYQPEELIGKNLNQIFGTENEALIMFHLKSALADRDGGSKVFEYQYVYNNNLYFFEARISRISDRAVIAIVRNKTKEQYFEQYFLLFNKLQQMLYRLLRLFSHASSDGIDLDTEYDKILVQLSLFAGTDKACVFEYDQQRNVLKKIRRWVASNDLSVKETDIEFNAVMLTEWLDRLKKQEKIIVEDVQNEIDHNDYLYQMMVDHEVVSFCAAPLIEKEKFIGLLILASSKSNVKYTEEIVSLLKLFAEIVVFFDSMKKDRGVLDESKIKLELQNDKLLLFNSQLKKQNEDILLKNAALNFERERAEQSDKLKTAFLNNISHEIRTPLNGIVGFSQLLVNARSLEDRNDCVEAIFSSVDRLTSTVNDIMDVSLLMSGSMPINIETVYLDKLFQEVYDTHKKMAQSKGLELKLILLETTKDFAFDIDKGFIRKLISEIVENAIKYTKEGYVRFGFDIKNKQVCLYVEDTGIGISAEILPHINEPFIQGDNSSTRRVEGTGLGLTIVSGIVELLKGTIKIDTKIGEGTTYKIFIPINAAMEINNTQENPVKTAQTPTANENWPTVLLAEDEDLNVLYAKRIFKSKNFNVLYVRNGKEAVNIVETNPDVKVILMDVKMPIMDGLEATKRIKEMNPNIIIIAVTAYSANDDRIRCLNTGCDDYMSKPFRPVDLFDMLRKWLPDYEIE